MLLTCLYLLFWGCVVYYLVLVVALRFCIIVYVWLDLVNSIDIIHFGFIRLLLDFSWILLICFWCLYLYIASLDDLFGGFYFYIWCSLE